MHRIIRIKAYEAEHGPHFNDEHARKAVSKMENEDGTRGQHWSLEETTALANQYGIRLDEKINKYDWYVALNMVYSDYYRVVVSMTGSNNTKYFVELAKAWMHDKDIDEGKMWFYYIYVMCDKIRNAEEDLFERHYSKYEDDDGNKEAISTLSNTLNCDINSVQSALNTINTSVSQIACDTKLSGAQVINAIQSGNASLASQLASCCCDVRNAITTQGYESQLAIVNQTNTLTSNANTQFNILGAKIDAQTQIINDKFCQLEMREMQNKIDSLRQENNQLALAASQQAQTANIVNQLRPTPVPAYLTCNPYGCNGGFTGYGYNGYSDGCGCGC